MMGPFGKASTLLSIKPLNKHTSAGILSSLHFQQIKHLSMQPRVCLSWSQAVPGHTWTYLNTAKVEVENKLGIRPTTLWLRVNWATQTSRKAGVCKRWDIPERERERERD